MVYCVHILLVKYMRLAEIRNYIHCKICNLNSVLTLKTLSHYTAITAFVQNTASVLLGHREICLNYQIYSAHTAFSQRR